MADSDSGEPVVADAVTDVPESRPQPVGPNVSINSPGMPSRGIEVRFPMLAEDLLRDLGAPKGARLMVNGEVSEAEVGPGQDLAVVCPVRQS